MEDYNCQLCSDHNQLLEATRILLNDGFILLGSQNANDGVKLYTKHWLDKYGPIEGLISAFFL